MSTGGYKPFEDADALRASGQYRTLTPEQFVDELKAKGPNALVIFHPMMGGIPPALAWDSLRLFEREVHGQDIQQRIKPIDHRPAFIRLKRLSKSAM